MIKKHKFLIIFIISVLVIFTGIFVALRFQDGNKQTNYKSELYTNINNTFTALFNTETYEYVNDNFLNKASDVTLNASIEKFSPSPDYENLCFTANIRKNKDNSHLTTDIRTTYKGIQLISGKFEYNEPEFKFYSPSIYEKVIAGDFSLIKNGTSMFFRNNTIFRIIDEFSIMYPEEAKEISQHINVTQDKDGYNFTITAKAAKIFLKTSKEFIFESDTCKSLWSDYITGEYYANPNNSDYYTLEEYKAQYLESNKPFIQSTFDLAADLINFDITVHFATDASGNITAITYNDGNTDIGGIIDLTLTPYKNTFNIDGYLSLMLAENNYKIDIFRENSKNQKILLTTSRIDITTNDNNCVSFITESNLDLSTNTQSVTLDISGQDSEISLLCEAKYKPLSGDIISIKKDEINLSDMNIFELSKLLNDIQENLNNELFYALP